MIPSLRITAPALALSSFLLLAHSASAGQVWEIWTRICYSDNMATEWLVADDKNWEGLFPPEKTSIHLLVPPTVKKVGSYWEITFDPTGKKKELLAQHFDNEQAYMKRPDGYKGRPTSSFTWPIDPVEKKASNAWLILRSKDYVDGKPDQPNVDPGNAYSSPAFNLDPENTIGIAFVEPKVTEQDGQWILTAAEAPGDMDKKVAQRNQEQWEKKNPGPKPSEMAKAPKIRYPAKFQKKIDEFEEAMREWHSSGRQTPMPKFEEYLQLTPEQKKQFDAWQEAKAKWYQSGGKGPFPQPSSFLKS